METDGDFTNLAFYNAWDDNSLYYGRRTPDLESFILIAVNLVAVAALAAALALIAGRLGAPVLAGAAVGVTPAVIATPGGALAVWSRLTGDGYQVVASRMSGGRWQAPRELGPPGSLYPTFHRRHGATRVLFRTVLPAPGWSALELDGDGTVRRRASWEGRGAGRPALVADERGRVELRDPDGRIRPPRGEREP